MVIANNITNLLIIFISLINIRNILCQCLNPNENFGYCVSLYECPSLLSVVQKQPLSEFDKKFLTQSECKEGFGRPPLVCCNYDIGFDRQPPSSFPSQRFLNNRQNPFTFFPRSLDPSPIIRNGFSGGGNLPSPPECGADSIANKIFSGTNTQLDEFPWIVLLEYRRKSGLKGLNCAGTLLNNRYVLTAAHCVTGAVIKQIGELKSVRLGEYDTTKNIDCFNGVCADPVVEIGIEQIIPHERFEDGAIHRHNDIALIRLNQPVRYTDYIRPICLPSSLKSDIPAVGTKLVVAGWGRTLSSRRSTIKQKLTIPVAEQAQCQQKFLTKNVNIIDSQICAGGKNLEDSCDGDSGGPLMRYFRNSWVLEGIVSFGIRCGFADWPAVHTRVSSYDQWIKSKIKV